MKRRSSTRNKPARRLAVPVYRGPWGPEQAERLTWRAGFGPRPGDVERLAKMSMREAVLSYTRPKGSARMQGPAPTDEKGRPLAPQDAWGHDHLWWLDRMVRSDQPLVERMTLVFHDWFATSKEGASAKWMLRQNSLIRRNAFGRFDTLVKEITRDPAMLLWLSGSSNNKWSPNENYARELMELFTLGAGRGYTERDVREMARALTGWRNDWSESQGAVRFRYDKTFHDNGVKRIFGKRGRFDWRDACELCLEHRLHPSFFVRKLWGYFIPTPPSKRTQAALEQLYVRSGHQIRPVLEAILMHPDFHQGPRMVKPPVVLIAGMLRTTNQGINDEHWTWVANLAGQYLFLPPSVAGWDDERWIDTATWRGRWIGANYALQRDEIKEAHNYAPDSPEEAVAKAIAHWGNPHLSAPVRESLLAFARRCETLADARWKKASYPRLRQNALRMLVATSPDYNTC